MSWRNNRTKAREYEKEWRKSKIGKRGARSRVERDGNILLHLWKLFELSRRASNCHEIRFMTRPEAPPTVTPHLPIFFLSFFLLAGMQQPPGTRIKWFDHRRSSYSSTLLQYKYPSTYFFLLSRIVIEGRPWISWYRAIFHPASECCPDKMTLIGNTRDSKERFGRINLSEIIFLRCRAFIKIYIIGCRGRNIAILLIARTFQYASC